MSTYNCPKYNVSPKSNQHCEIDEFIGIFLQSTNEGLLIGIWMTPIAAAQPQVPFHRGWQPHGVLTSVNLTISTESGISQDHPQLWGEDWDRIGGLSGEGPLISLPFIYRICVCGWGGCCWLYYYYRRSGYLCIVLYMSWLLGQVCKGILLMIQRSKKRREEEGRASFV